MHYASTKKKSGNSLLRVALLARQDSRTIRDQLEKLGCSTEQSHLQSLFAVNVPQNVRIEEVRGILDEGTKLGLWDYEEPILRQ